MLIDRYWSKLSWLAAVLLCLSVLGTNVFAGSTGQIRGKVTDKVKKTDGELIGVSVQVVGTVRGAVTDEKGEFLIRNLEPGTYDLKFSSTGYQPVIVTGIEVKIDQTTEVKSTLEETTTELQAIIVTGKKDIIEKSNVEGKIALSAKQIANKPVSTVDDILTTQAGVTTTRNGQVFIRGGRAGEVSYILDGVPISDGLGGSSSQNINQQLASGAIQEIEVIKSGFSPEYGEALSGIVNIRSPVGSKDATEFSMEYDTDDFGSAKLNKYSRNEDRVVAKLSGPDPIITKRILPALGLNFLSDKEFTYFLYAEVNKDDGATPFNRYNTPDTRSSFGNYSLLGLKIPNRENNSYHVQTNFQFRPEPTLRIIGSYKFWDRKNVVFGSDPGWNYRYSMSTIPINTNRQSIYSLEVDHQLDQNTSYDAIISYNNSITSTKPGDPNNPGHGLNPDQMKLTTEWESFEDRNGNGVYDTPEPIINLYPDTATYGNDIGLPRYTKGELDTIDGSNQFHRTIRFNNNGINDNFQGEAFIDLNGNGVWDQGDVLRDKNGNGQLDDDRLGTVRTPTAEPFVDGDSIVGEPFTDLNGNGVYDKDLDGFTISIDPAVNQDLNYDGTYNPPLPNNNPNNWSPGIPYYDRNHDGVFNFANGRHDEGEEYTDLNRNGKYDLGGASTFLTPGTYSANGSVWEERVQRTLRGELKVTRVVGRHELKAGFNISRNDFSYGNIARPYVKYTGRLDDGAYPDRGAFRDFFAYDPIQGAAYFLDRLEYGSLIASIGVRWDFFLQDVTDVANNFARDDQGGNILGDRHKISPRIGFSYPISDKAKVYFNYGHFFQLPSLTTFYQRNTTSADAADVLGNPNLDYQKTIQYSFGVKYAINDDYAIDFQGYFKDEFDKLNQISILRGSVTRSVYGNVDYGRSRGVEITIDKRAGGFVTGNLSYTYAFAYGKASQATETLLNPSDLAKTPLDETPLDDDIRHSLKSSIQFFIPNTVKPRLFGLPIPNGWSLVFETVISTGKPFTPDKSYPDLVLDSRENPPRNSLRKPTTAFFDIRFSKEFQLAGIDYSLVLQVQNLLNTVNVETVYTKTGRPDTQQNINGLVLRGTDYDNNPLNYGEGRQIRLGLLMQL